MDELFQQAQTEVDPEIRKRVFWKIQDNLVCDLPGLWIFQERGSQPVRTGDSRERVDLK